GQKYQNKHAFKIIFDTQAVVTHQKVCLDYLCQKCIEVIKWKMQYNKYKKATSESRCSKCQQKNIFKSYRHCCDVCAKQLKICAKCLLPTNNLSVNEKDLKVKQEKEQKEMEEYLTKLRERTRRTLIRKHQNNLVQWNSIKKCFIDSETGQNLDNLKFKQGLENEDNVEEGDQCEEFNNDDFDALKEEQQQIKIKQKKMLEQAKQISLSSDQENSIDEEDDIEI
ncbi:hypothetical protein IMG5_027100, partial [Ichthyophthirius multifiliis]